MCSLLMLESPEFREALRLREELKAKLLRAQLDVARYKAELSELEQRTVRDLDLRTELICW